MGEDVVVAGRGLGEDVSRDRSCFISKSATLEGVPNLLVRRVRVRVAVRVRV